MLERGGGNLFFQPLPGGRALLNGDPAAKPPAPPDLDPPVWFMHFRGVGSHAAVVPGFALVAHQIEPVMR